MPDRQDETTRRFTICERRELT